MYNIITILCILIYNFYLYNYINNDHFMNLLIYNINNNDNRNNIVNYSRITNRENRNINIRDSENNSIVINDVANRSIGENRVNLSNCLNNECVNIYVTWYRSYNFLLDGRDADIIDLNYKKEWDVLIKSPVISGDYSKMPFFVDLRLSL